jgi:hypothetical protein
MAKTAVAGRAPASNPTRKHVPPTDVDVAADIEAGQAQSGGNDMNMMTSIEAAAATAAMSKVRSAVTIHARRRPKFFLDERGRPSHRAGPDLRKAEPIEDVLAYLSRRRKQTYGVAFYRAARRSGISVSVFYSREGEEYLQMGLPCDTQDHLRRRRYDVLAAHVHGRPWRYRAVMDIANFLGHFADNRRYDSVKEAAENYIAVGGRIYVLPGGSCEENLSLTSEMLMAESWEGYPLRRLSHRYDATLRAKGARDELAQLVRQHGRLHEGSGSIVWTGGDL